MLVLKGERGRGKVVWTYLHLLRSFRKCPPPFPSSRRLGRAAFPKSTSFFVAIYVKLSFTFNVNTFFSCCQCEQDREDELYASSKFTQCTLSIHLSETYLCTSRFVETAMRVEAETLELDAPARIGYVRVHPAVHAPHHDRLW